MIKVKTVFPLLQVPSPASAAAFYVEHFGFEVAFEADWYVQLRSGTSEVAFIEVGHESLPAARRQAAHAVCLTIELETPADVDAAHAAVSDKMEITTTLRDESWGQRHFLGIDPSGVMLDVVCSLGDTPGV